MRPSKVRIRLFVTKNRITVRQALKVLITVTRGVGPSTAPRPLSRASPGASPEWHLPLDSHAERKAEDKDEDKENARATVPPTPRRSARRRSAATGSVDYLLGTGLIK